METQIDSYLETFSRFDLAADWMENMMLMYNPDDLEEASLVFVNNRWRVGLVFEFPLEEPE